MPLPPLPEDMGAVLADYGEPAKPTRRSRAARTAPTSATAATADAKAGGTAPEAETAAAAKPAAKAKTKRMTTADSALVKAPAKAPAKTKAPAKNVAQKQAGKVEEKPAAKPEEKPDAKSAAKAAKPAKAAEPKTEVKVEAKAEAKPVKKPAAKKGPMAAADAAQVLAPQKLPSTDPQTRSAAGRRGRIVTPEDKPKLFVLDTNVLMHDPLSLFRFAEHDVFLPMTTLEELDNHKKGLTDVARNARTVSRTLDNLIELNGGDILKGVPLNLLGNIEAGGRLFFETTPMAKPLPGLPGIKGDNSILATVGGAMEAFSGHAVVLVSKDINMRIKATTLGIPAEDYFNDKILDDTDMVYTGRSELPASFWDEVKGRLECWNDGGATCYAFETDEPSKWNVNECVTIEGDDAFAAIVTAVEGRTVKLRLLKDFRSKHKVWGIQARNAEQNMALNLLMDPEIDFVTLLGQAGTGKTLLTLAAALAQTIDQRRFSEIIVTRATVSVGEDIGYLPGTEEEKMAPWMGALEDNLEVLHKSDGSGDWDRQAAMDLIRNRIRIKSMSFMRGRTFLQKFVIIDEAQNLSPKQMKTLITRAGPGTKIVCLGNIAQIDTPYLTEGSSGLTYVVERFAGWPHAATITLARGERSRLAEFAAEAL